jgi:spermidine synthase
MTSLDLTTTGNAAAGHQGLARWTRVLSVLFFFSGFPALIYQLTWQRALFLIFGVNIESVTIVVTAFMLGLGLGSLAGGWLSKARSLPPLLLLAGIEFLTAVFGLVSLPVFDKVGEYTIGLSLPATAASALALVLVPTLLMGATLPVLVKHVACRLGNTGSAVGLLYYVNTLGAAAACLVSGTLLFPFLGMSGAIDVAVAMNGAVALGALAAYWLDKPDAVLAPSAPAIRYGHEPALALAAGCGLAAAGGFVSLSYEIFFFRTISFTTGSSATAFALTLGAFLVGIASGSREAGEVCETTTRAEAMRKQIDALLMASVLGIVFLPVLNHTAWLGEGLTGVAVVATYFVARFWGSLLPYLAELSIFADSKAGMRTGLLYLANILGSAAGSVITGFVLMNAMGLVGIASTLVLEGLACTLALIVAVAVPRRQKLQRIAFAGALGLAALVVAPPLSDGVLESLQWKGATFAPKFSKVLENRSGIITVAEGGIVFGHGMYDGRFNTDLKNDTNGIVRPYALSLFHSAPRDVLMIGLSTGSWAQVIANDPAVRTLTVVEINPGYLSLIADEIEVASVLRNPKVTIVTDDGRRWLRAHPERHFDAVVSNTTWYYRANVTNLLSVEFLEMVRSHLNPGGIFFYNTTGSDRVQRTGCNVYQYGARFTNHMVVSDAPIAWDFERWRRTLEAYRIDDLPIFDPARAKDRAEIDGLVSWQKDLTSEREHDVGRMIEPCPDILKRTAGRRAVTDDNMGSEWLHFYSRE